jgi:hypothetical protein
VSWCVCGGEKWRGANIQIIACMPALAGLIGLAGPRRSGAPRPACGGPGLFGGAWGDSGALPPPRGITRGQSERSQSRAGAARNRPHTHAKGEHARRSSPAAA